jgi:hypothetical protein|tara:strand:+ start:112 stop:804 length:693 start_codon:yes stop_codon:yes gene_type:complete
MSNFIDDISTLDGELGDIDMPTEDEPYDVPRIATNRTPPAGRYNLQLPTEVKVGAWPASEGRPGSIELTFDPVVVSNPGGPGDGMEIRFVSVSTRRIGGANASSATDLLQRLGYSPLPRNAAEWQDAARAVAGQLAEGVYCDWECRAPKDTDPDSIRNFLKETAKLKVTDKKARKILIRGMKNFPSDGQGGHISRMQFEEGPNGQSLTLYANLKPTLRGFGITAAEKATS